MKNKGLTLIELLIVIAVTAIIFVAMGYEYVGWQAKYKIESQIKDIYGDLMDARMRTTQRKRIHFVKIDSDRYYVFEDDDPAPDGDGSLDTSKDKEVTEQFLDPDLPMQWSGGNEIKFTSGGLADIDKTICIMSDHDTDYAKTRINLGQIQTKGGNCDNANCVAK